MSPNLLPALMRMQELSCLKRVCVTLVSNILWDKLIPPGGLPPPIQIFFPQYNQSKYLYVSKLIFFMSVINLNMAFVIFLQVIFSKYYLLIDLRTILLISTLTIYSSLLLYSYGHVETFLNFDTRYSFMSRPIYEWIVWVLCLRSLFVILVLYLIILCFVFLIE